ncbi:MAG: M48 family metallopeptidase [Salinivirgaceae bacterium]|nr:M48 family metallopeptidase [Salinivirgaceae bacterium]
MKSKLYSLPIAGDIIVYKHSQSKKLSIKLKPNSIPTVIIPTLMTYDMGFRFACEKEEWIVEHMELLSKKKVPKLLINESNGFKTRFHEIIIVKHSKKSIQNLNHGTQIKLMFPENENIDSTENQNRIKNFILNILRVEAKKYLPLRTQFFAEKYDFKYNQIFIKNQKTRWGSCSGKNNINLNLHLMRLPEHLSDFIILHELCHTVHMNHGSNFHELLNRLTGNEKELNKELRKYTTQL